MKLADWASIFEIVSSIAVLITLAILIFQVADNTSAVRSNAYQQIISNTHNALLEVSSSSELAKAFSANTENRLDELDEGTQTQFVAWQRAVWRNYEGAYFHWKRGILGAEEWQTYYRVICRAFNRNRKLWMSNHQGSFAGSFMAEVEKCPKEA